MAIVQYGAIVTEIKGSIGGWTFQKNPSGSIIRLRPRQKRVPTEKQSAQRNKFIRYLCGWQRLIQVEKNLWNDYASLFTKVNPFGRSKTLTGQNWYQSINSNRNLVGLTTLSSPPIHELPCDVQDFTINMDYNTFSITFDPPFDPADASLIIRTTYPITISSRSIEQYIKLTKTITSGPFSTIDLKTAWENTHGITYPPSLDSYSFSIAILVQTLKKSSGIASAGLIKSKFLIRPAGGIGTWIIEDTFIVQ